MIRALVDFALGNKFVVLAIAALLLGLAEIEHTNIKERQKAGIEAAKLRGVYTGRARGSTKANPMRARELKQKGLTNAEVSVALGISHRTLRRYLADASRA